MKNCSSTFSGPERSGARLSTNPNGHQPGLLTGPGVLLKSETPLPSPLPAGRSGGEKTRSAACQYCGESFTAPSRALLGAALSKHLPKCPELKPFESEGWVSRAVAAVRLGVSQATVQRRGIASERPVKFRIRVRMQGATGRLLYSVEDCQATVVPEPLPAKAKAGRPRRLFTRCNGEAGAPPGKNGRGAQERQRELTIQG